MNAVFDYCFTSFKEWLEHHPISKLLFFITIAVLAICWLIFYGPLPNKENVYTKYIAETTSKVNCYKPAKNSLITRGAPSAKHSYFLVSDTADISKVGSITDFQNVRTKLFEQVLRKGDGVLSAAGKGPYAYSLLPFLVGGTEFHKSVMSEFFNRYFISVEEDVDTLHCKYSLSVWLGKSVSTPYINDIVSFASDSLCLGQLIQKIVIDPLNRDGFVSFSFIDIYIGICQNCNSGRVLRQLSDNAATGQNVADSLYFDKGQYKLKFASLFILDGLKKKLLQEKKGSLSISFEGYADPTQVEGINYIGPKTDFEKGTLLPQKGVANGSYHQILKSNTELSFARGFSAYSYIKSTLYDYGFQMSYTGWGVDSRAVNNQTKRSVFINLRKIN